jgi:signal transduction histidine kinase
MKRPWQVWLLFAVCVLGAFAGMVWVTRQALKADERRRVAEAQAELEQRASLALWRMDTKLAPIIAEEVIRPPSAYRPTDGGPIDPPQYVLLQFEARPNGIWLSPQTPISKSPEPARLTELRNSTAFPWLIALLPKAPLPTVEAANRELLDANSPPAQMPLDGPSQVQYFEGNLANLPQQSEPPAQQPAPNQVANRGANANPQADFQQRNRRYQDATQQSILNYQQRAEPTFEPPKRFESRTPAEKASAAPHEQIGISRPLWVGDHLLLARRVGQGPTTFVQGSWLDWDRLKAHLLNEVTDLSLDADLVPVSEDTAGDPSRMLAGLPARLAVGSKILAGAVSPSLAWALKLGWVAILLAVIAAAILLAGVMTLSERRAAFVSSVTHELRTPLTTFRMYSEMLAKGMVPDAARRQEYFDTLQRESERLTLLVENVLAYARLERGRRPQGRDRVTLDALFDRIGPRLRQRAAQAGMECIVELQDNKAPSLGSPSERPLPEGEGSKTEFTTDQAVVEQILFNLVDNAAKYACKATDRRIHVDVERNGQFVKLTVRDHGPGMQTGLWSRHNEPFTKSAQESAETAPGVGLGLVLCKRLARQLGGKLEFAAANGDGAKISLSLPTL